MLQDDYIFIHRCVYEAINHKSISGTTPTGKFLANLRTEHMRWCSCKNLEFGPSAILHSSCV